MSFGWIITLLVKILGLFGGKGTRIKFEARPESSIEKEQELLNKLKEQKESLDRELTNIIHQIIKAKQDGNTNLESKLNDKWAELHSKYQNTSKRIDELERCKT